jgi:hypothetical protein
MNLEKKLNNFSRTELPQTFIQADIIEVVPACYGVSARVSGIRGGTLLEILHYLDTKDQRLLIEYLEKSIELKSKEVEETSE